MFFSTRTIAVLVAVGIGCATAVGVRTGAGATPRNAAGSYPPSPSPVAFLPGFATVTGWEESRASARPIPGPYRTPAILAAAALCGYFNLPFEADVAGGAALSPLEWPRAFADELIRARRQRADIETLLAASGLAFHPVVTLEVQESVDSILMALAAGTPVLLNTPGAQIIYGYDRREADLWWWMQEGDHAEIVFEPERVARYVFWDDDPAANLFWVITGTAEPTSALGGSQTEDYELLKTVSRSVAGDPELGIEPYPLSLRRMSDRIEASDALPALAEPIDSLDPIGAARALAARVRLSQSIERLVPMATDSALSAPLRLAQYYYHNSTAAIEQLNTVFYADSNRLGRIGALRANWSDYRRREEAVRLFQDALRWERDALTEVNRALAVYNHTDSD